MIQGYMLELLPVNFAPSHNAVPNAVPFFFLQGMRTLGHVLECSSPRRRRYLTPGGGGGTRYIPGWGGAARPFIP